jgi:hypothetical protein
LYILLSTVSEVVVSAARESIDCRVDLLLLVEYGDG